MRCLLMKILSLAGAKKKTKRLKFFLSVARLLVVFKSRRGSEGVKYSDKECVQHRELLTLSLMDRLELTLMVDWA